MRLLCTSTWRESYVPPTTRAPCHWTALQEIHWLVVPRLAPNNWPLAKTFPTPLLAGPIFVVYRTCELVDSTLHAILLHLDNAETMRHYATSRSRPIESWTREPPCRSCPRAWLDLNDTW